jgi:hypothetical protein
VGDFRKIEEKNILFCVVDFSKKTAKILIKCGRNTENLLFLLYFPSTKAKPKRKTSATCFPHFLQGREKLHFLVPAKIGRHQ